MEPIILDDCFDNGLRPSTRMNRDKRFLKEMLNAIPLGRGRGADELVQVTYPISSPSYSADWPFPQILRDDRQVMYLEDDAIYTVTTSSYPYATVARDVFHAYQVVANRHFNDTSAWTTPAGWAIASGVATASGATSNDLSQTGILTNGVVYLITFTMTRSAGSLTPTFGTTAGTTRSADGTYTEEVTANGADFSFNAAGFTGTVDNVSIVKKITLTESGAWHLAAFQDRVTFLTNGAEFISRLPSYPVDGSSRDIFMSTDAELTVQAIAKHKNALVIGGLAGTQLVATNMAALFDHWRKTQEQNILTTEDDTLDTSCLFYSAMSGDENDLPFSVFFGAMGYPDAEAAGLLLPIALGRIETKEMGFFRPRYCGPIRCMKELGDALIVYGRDGICALTRTEAGYVETQLLDQGVPTRTSVAGDDQEHMFVTNQKDIYSLAPSAAPKWMEFAEHIGNLTIGSLVVTFDPGLRYWWFADGATSYCWTGFGLGQSSAVIPSSILRMQDATGVLGTAITASDPQTVRMVSAILSMPNRQTYEASSADIHCLEADSSSWTANMDWRLKNSDSFRRPTAIDSPDRGRTFVKKTGVDMRLVLTAPNYKDQDVKMVHVATGIGKMSITNILNSTDSVLTETYP